MRKLLILPAITLFISGCEGKIDFKQKITNDSVLTIDTNRIKKVPIIQRGFYVYYKYSEGEGVFNFTTDGGFPKRLDIVNKIKIFTKIKKPLIVQINELPIDDYYKYFSK